MEETNVAQALADLRKEVRNLAAQVAAQDKKLRWITSAALVIVGAIGGPNAVDLITSSGAM